MALERRTEGSRLWRRRILLAVLTIAVLLLVVSWDRLLFSYRLSSAQAALRNRRPAEAIAQLSRSAKRGEDSAKWNYLLACAQRRRGRSVEAERHLARAAHLGWSKKEVDRQRLLLQAQSGTIRPLDDRLVALLDARVSDAQAEETYEAVARGYLASMQLPEASRCLAYWLEFQPANPVPHLWMAELYRRTEKNDFAVAELRRVLELEPDHHEAALKLAQLQLELANNAEAAALFARCRADPATEEEALFGLAECRLRQGDTEQAQSLLYDALLLDLPPDKAAQALTSLGQLALEERDSPRALQLLEQAVNLDPYDSKGRLALAGAFLAMNEPEQAQTQRTAARQLVEQSTRLVSLTRRVVTEPNDAELRSQIGLTLIELGRIRPAIDWLKTALQIDPGHVTAHRALADCYRRLGDNQQASEHSSAANAQSQPRSERPPSHASKEQQN